MKINDGEYYYHLDSLRGIAAIMVVLLHANWTNHFTQNSFIQFGAIFVDFFFVLSGVVISHVYPQIRPGQELWIFLKRRFARLYPLHLLTLLAVASGFLILYLFFPGVWANASRLPEMQGLQEKFFLNLFFLNAHNLTNENSFNGPSWSIGAEVTCYIIYSLILMFFYRNRILVYVLLFLSSFLLLSTYNKSIVSFQQDWGFLRGIFGFFLGCIVYYCRFYVKIPSSKKLLPLLFVISIIFYLIIERTAFPRLMTFIFPVLFGVLIFLLFTPHAWVRSLLNLKPFLFLGTLSYSTYMLHFLIKWFLNLVLTLIFPVKATGELLLLPMGYGDLLLAIYLGLVIGVSWLSYHYFEEPLRRLLR